MKSYIDVGRRIMSGEVVLRVVSHDRTQERKLADQEFEALGKLVKEGKLDILDTVVDDTVPFPEPVRV